MKKIRNLDFTIVILICTIVFIGCIYIYLSSVQNKRIEYDLYDKNLYLLKILNNKFDNFILNSIAFKNYDEIVKDVKKFEDILNALENSSAYKEFQKDLNPSLRLIKDNFLKKKDIVERYKSYKASIFYSLAYIIELQKESKMEHEDKEIHELLNEILFRLFRLFMNYSKEDSTIKKDIYNLEKNHTITDNSPTQFFLMHAKTLYSEIQSINQKKEILISLPLYANIDLHQTIYMNKLKEMNNMKGKVYNSLFFLSIFLLLVLLASYIKTIKLKKDLVSFKYAVENSDDSVVVTDVDRQITYVNESFTRVTGYTKKEALGQNPSILKSGEMPQEFYTNMNKMLNRGEKWSGEFVNKDKNGEIYYEKASITPMFTNGELSGYLAIELNVTDYIKEKKKVEFLAYHDRLTSLPNRRMMKEVLTQEIKIAQKDGLHVDLLFLDLDGFKSINDTLGHDIGDFFLQEISKKLKKFLNKENILFRTGGDEFAIILNNKNEVIQSEIVASEIIHLINETIFKDDNELTAGVSIGIAKLDILKDDVVSLLKHADIAMYEAKNSGKNKFCHYTKKLSEKIQNKMQIKQELKNAFKRDEFYVVYQPKYSLKTKEISSLEVLIRWKHPRLGMISPDYFIPIAEETKSIQEIGIFVFKQACIDFLELKNSINGLENISVNLSTAQLMNQNLLAEFKSIVVEMDIEAKNIGLEITETHIMRNIEKATEILKQMKEFGFKIIMDDFGTGYSSMSYLKKLPISELKIDKSFVDDICHDENDVKIVKAIISVAKSFDYKIVAEGIETREQEDILRDLGIDTGQGYYFSKPKRKKELF